jgi:NADH-quinone oxidoreductase subunit E
MQTESKESFVGDTGRERLARILAAQTGEPEALIPVLQAVQSEFGHLPRGLMPEIARYLGVPESTVYGVATFYSQFHLAPQGRHRIKVCEGTACHVRGGRALLEAISGRLGIRPGETTPDYRYSLEQVACFGSCALAPIVVVDNRVYGKVTPEQIERILEELD